MTTNLNKIIVKKTKVQVINEIQITSWQSETECFKKLIIQSIILGASGNCLKQVSRAGITDEDFKAIKEAQEKFENICYELESSISILTDNLCPSSHTFH